MKTERLLKLASEKEFVVNRFKHSQDKLRQQCWRLVKSGRLEMVEKTNEQLKFRTVRI
jgi:hypothetical protein